MPQVSLTLMLKSRSGSRPMAIGAGSSFVAITVHVKMADKLGVAIPCDKSV